MDITKIFELISEQMKKDFEVSAEFIHNGLRGDYREDSLKKFLSSGKLPKQYSIGNGEIISSYSQTSKQTDLVIYDSNKSIILHASKSMQIFPIESIYGVIEVKSKLSKVKLEEALENIKSIKTIYTPTQISKNLGKGTKAHYHTNPPFGLIFAYDLDNNSLNSLEKNLNEWCKKNPPEVWPNLICILNHGIFKFRNGINEALHSSDINSSSALSNIDYKENSLFEFTTSLISLCNAREIDIFDISTYQSQGIIIDGLRVKEHNIFTNSKTGEKCRLTDEFIKHIYESCQTTMPIPYNELLFKIFGKHDSLIEHFYDKTFPVYLYNPSNYLGLAEVIQRNNAPNTNVYSLLSNTASLVHGTYLSINEYQYYIPSSYITDDKIQ